MNAETPRNEALANAFRFGGIIHAGLDDLERHSRDMAMQSLEAQLAEAWREEVNPSKAGSVDDPTIAPTPRKPTYVPDNAVTRAKRERRKRRIVEMLSHWPLSRSDFADAINLSRAALNVLLRDMCNEGLINMRPIPGRGRQFVYEVAQ